ncbi:MAG TPA: DUF488 family protein [Gemmatimonadaceae bacterium]|nr:DUF488 family protein [Gemmatimonadaceae bacterium]
MAIRIVRLGTPRARDEGPRLGTVRRPPRGVKKQDHARLNFYDVWLPDLAPSAQLVSWALVEPWTAARWKRFARRYHTEMKKPEAQRLLMLLATLSHETNFSVGCYCENESHCHRSLLRDLLVSYGATLRP